MLAVDGEDVLSPTVVANTHHGSSSLTVNKMVRKGAAYSPSLLFLLTNLKNPKATA